MPSSKPLLSRAAPCKPSRGDSKWKLFAGCAFIFGSIGCVYAPVHNFQFVDFDDDLYVVNNSFINAGLSASSVRWAFTNIKVFYWQPLAWLSHMLDCQMFGLNSGPPHVVNVLLHIANSVLLFLLIRSVTGAFYRSLVVSAIFALHPLRVESVAWISERKDLLSGLFWILTIWAYFWYTKRPSLTRYIVVASTFVLGLMAKPVLITLPPILIVLDYWPLRRYTGGLRDFWHSFREKLPLLILSIASCAITLFGLAQAHATADISWQNRLANASVAYLLCLEKLLWPANLAVLYPYRPHIDPLLVLSALGLITGLIAVAWRARERHPYVVAGIAWYLIGLAPTAGLVVQSGSQCFADRFSYISAIGLVIAATWTTAAAIRNLANHRAITAGIVIALVGVLSYRSSAQVLVWKDSISLFSRALEVAPESAIVQHNLGYALASAGRVDEAIVRYRAALSIDPTLYRAHYNLGRALFDRGDLGRALKEFDAALSFPLEPNYKADVLNASGIAFASVGNFAAAEQRFRSALQLEPRSSVIHANLASFLARAGRLDEAIGWYKVAVAESPSYTEARLNLAHALSDAGSRDEAIEEYRTVLRQSPGRPEALAALQRFSMSR